MDSPLVVVRCGPGFAVLCPVHGLLPTLWTSEGLAGFDALGHAAHHHAVSARR